MSTPYSTAAVIEAYTDHPLSRAAILGRLQRNGLTPAQVTELELALDPDEEITDQNHIGGTLSTLRLAALAGVTRESRVLDLGCGIGGPARLLAEIFGCRVHGVDANSSRIDDANALAELVGLADRTSFEVADFLTCSFSQDYSIMWAQNTWIHVGDPTRLARIAAVALRKWGRLAFEDVVLRRAAVTSDDRALIEQVATAWRSSFMEFSGWTDQLAETGLDIIAIEHDDRMMITYLSRLCTLADRFPDRYPPHETAGWRGALRLAHAGVLGYTRIIGAKSRWL